MTQIGPELPPATPNGAGLIPASTKQEGLPSLLAWCPAIKRTYSNAIGVSRQVGFVYGESEEGGNDAPDWSSWCWPWPPARPCLCLPGTRPRRLPAPPQRRASWPLSLSGLRSSPSCLQHRERPALPCGYLLPSPTTCPWGMSGSEPRRTAIGASASSMPPRATRWSQTADASTSSRELHAVNRSRDGLNGTDAEESQG